MKIVYEDDNYVGFFKPEGIPTVYGEDPKCFLDEIKKEKPELLGFCGFKIEEGGLLYRLDNETSGLLLFAKNHDAFLKFVNDDSVRKIYLAEVSSIGRLQNHGEINYKIVHKSSKKMAVLMPGKKITYSGKPIETTTFYRQIKDNLFECSIKKGARHQIRVHLKSMEAPIIGDKLYGGAKSDKLHLTCVGIKSNFLNVDIR